MKAEVKEVLDNYCLKNGWTVCETPDEFEELLTGAKQVYSEIGDSHRWYDEMFVVADFHGVLIGYNWYHITGDNSARDMGLELDLESVGFVEKKQRVTDYYEMI